MIFVSGRGIVGYLGLIVGVVVINFGCELFKVFEEWSFVLGRIVVGFYVVVRV